MKICYLTQHHQREIYHLLQRDVETNLYQLDILLTRGINPFNLDEWRGVYVNDKLIAVTVSVGRIKDGQPSSICVPYGDIEACRLLGEIEAEHGGTLNLLGPRDESDALYIGLGSPIARVYFDERLYVCRDQPNQDDFMPLRPAVLDELDIIEEMAGLMMEEDVGLNPRDVDPEQHRYSVTQRIKARKVLVGEYYDQLAFLIDVGTNCKLGAQVGGAYVPPNMRGKGLGVFGMKGCCDYLLPNAPMVTLLARETNIAAIRTHERAGYTRRAPFRLAEIKPTQGKEQP